MQRTIIQKLKSRKLWLSIASFVSMLMVYLGSSEGEASKVAALIMAGATVIGYVVGEGLADSGNHATTITYTTSDYVDEDAEDEEYSEEDV